MVELTAEDLNTLIKFPEYLFDPRFETLEEYYKKIIPILATRLLNAGVYHA